MREKSERERIEGCQKEKEGKEERERERELERQASQANGGKGREGELEGSNRTSKLNVEIRVECLAR